MHTTPLRQLFLAVLWMCADLGSSLAGPSVDAPAQELRAAELVESSVLGRGASEETLRKLQALLDGLVAKYPLDASIRNGRAEFFQAAGDPVKARDDWHEAERLDPKNAVVLNHLGGCALEDGEVEKSAGYFRRAVEAAPNAAAFHFDLANLLFMFRKQLPSADQPKPGEMIQAALLQYSEATRLQPLNEEYLRSYGEAFLILPSPDWHGALEVWERLEHISARKDFAYSNLARIHLKLGEKAKALECLSKINDPEFAVMKAKLSGDIGKLPE